MTRWLIYAALGVALVFGYQAFVSHQQSIGEQRAVARYELALSKQKAEAERQLAAETARVKEAEARLQIAYTRQESTDAQNLKTVDDLRARVRALLADRLRRPGAETGHGGSGAGAPGAADAGADHRAADRATAGGLVPAAAAQHLAALMADADRINVAYASCRADLLRKTATIQSE